MHKAGKILLAIGVIICIIGGVLFVGSADLVEYDIEDDNVFEGTSGTFTVDDDSFFSVYVKDDTPCEGFEATINNVSSGYNVFDHWCDDDEYEESFEGFTDVGFLSDEGVFSIGLSPGEYEVIDADAKIYIVDDGQELGEAVAGIMGILASWGILCCGIFFLLLGLILGLTLKTPEPVVVIAAGAAPMVGTMPVMGAQPAMAAAPMAAAPMAAAPMAAAPVAAPDPAQEYYNDLVAQGYDAATATQYTQQHYPGFQG
jgi:hypothetical protein